MGSCFSRLNKNQLDENTPLLIYDQKNSKFDMKEFQTKQQTIKRKIEDSRNKLEKYEQTFKEDDEDEWISKSYINEFNDQIVEEEKNIELENEKILRLQKDMNKHYTIQNVPNLNNTIKYLEDILEYHIKRQIENLNKEFKETIIFFSQMDDKEKHSAKVKEGIYKQKNESCYDELKTTINKAETTANDIILNWKNVEYETNINLNKYLGNLKEEKEKLGIVWKEYKDELAKYEENLQKQIYEKFTREINEIICTQNGTDYGKDITIIDICNKLINDVENSRLRQEIKNELIKTIIEEKGGFSEHCKRDKIRGYPQRTTSKLKKCQQMQSFTY